MLGEELLFRGLLLPRMRGAFGRWDWVANKLLFAMYHLHKIWSWPSMISSSFGYAWAAKRFRSLWMGVIVPRNRRLLHRAWSWQCSPDGIRDTPEPTCQRLWLLQQLHIADQVGAGRLCDPYHRAMRALICGAGIAGLTLACLLDRMELDVQLVERPTASGAKGT